MIKLKKVMINGKGKKNKLSGKWRLLPMGDISDLNDLEDEKRIEKLLREDLIKQVKP